MLGVELSSQFLLKLSNCGGNWPITQKLLGNQRQRACCFVNHFSRKPARNSWKQLVHPFGRHLRGFRCPEQPVRGHDLLSACPAPAGGWCKLCPMASPPSVPPSCHAFHAASALPAAGQALCGVSLGTGRPLCCGCFKGPRPIFDLLRSNVAQHAQSKTQPALNSASSKEEGKPGEGRRSSVGFSSSLSHFYFTV